MIAVVQPHRYTRLHNLFEEFCTCFNDADTVIVADVYAAGEAPIEGVDRDAAGRGPARARPSQRARAPERRTTCRRWSHDLARPGDFVVCLGAGNITAWAHALPGELRPRCNGLRRQDDGQGRRHDGGPRMHTNRT